MHNAIPVTNTNSSIIGPYTGSGSITTNLDLNSLISTVESNTKIHPNFRIELTKAENDGFVIQLTTIPNSTNGNAFSQYTIKPKIYINTDIQNLGSDIQNALMLELLKQ